MHRVKASATPDQHFDPRHPRSRGDDRQQEGPFWRLLAREGVGRQNPPGFGEFSQQRKPRPATGRPPCCGRVPGGGFGRLGAVARSGRRRQAGLSWERVRACWGRARWAIGQSGVSKQYRSTRSRRARALEAPFGFLIRVSTSFFHKRAEEVPFSRPVINLPGSDAMQPALSDYTRLQGTFLAGRNPRTLAAYQADLEDFHRFMKTRAITLQPSLRWSGGCSAARETATRALISLGGPELANGHYPGLSGRFCLLGSRKTIAQRLRATISPCIRRQSGFSRRCAGCGPRGLRSVPLELPTRVRPPRPQQ